MNANRIAISTRIADPPEVRDIFFVQGSNSKSYQSFVWEMKTKITVEFDNRTATQSGSAAIGCYGYAFWNSSSSAASH